jgi:hypothetical protein
MAGAVDGSASNVEDRESSHRRCLGSSMGCLDYGAANSVAQDGGLAQDPLQACRDPIQGTALLQHRFVRSMEVRLRGRWRKLRTIIYSGPHELISAAIWASARAWSSERPSGPNNFFESRASTSIELLQATDPLEPGKCSAPCSPGVTAP